MNVRSCMYNITVTVFVSKQLVAIQEDSDDDDNDDVK